MLSLIEERFLSHETKVWAREVTIKGFLQLLNCFQTLTIGLSLFNQITLKGKQFNQFSKPLPLLAHIAFRVSHLLRKRNVCSVCSDLG